VYYIPLSFAEASACFSPVVKCSPRKFESSFLGAFETMPKEGLGAAF
jgi:hypothetical protein